MTLINDEDESVSQSSNCYKLSWEPDWISTKVWSSVVLTWEGHMHTQTVTPRQTLPLEGRQTLFLSIDLSNVAVADLLLICSYFYRAVSL